MNKILQALIAALAFVTNSRANTAALRKQVADLTTANSQLHDALDTAVAAQKTPDPALIQQIADLKAQRDQIQSDHQATLDSIAASETKAQELATSISENPDIPITQDPTTGSITLPGGAPTITLPGGSPTPLPKDVADNFAKQSSPFERTIPDDATGVRYSISRDVSGNYVASPLPVAAAPTVPGLTPVVPDPVVTAPAPHPPVDSSSSSSSSSSAPVLTPTISFLSGPNAGQTISIPTDIAENFATLAAANNPFTYAAPGDTVAYSITREEASGSYSAEVVPVVPGTMPAGTQVPDADPNLAPAPAGAPADTATLQSSSSSPAPVTGPVDTSVPPAAKEDIASSSSSAPATV